MHISDTNPLFDMCVANIFFQSIGCVDLKLCRAFWFNIAPLLFVCLFAFVICALSVISKKSLSRPKSRSFSPMFSSRSFMISDLIFVYLINFELF